MKKIYVFFIVLLVTVFFIVIFLQISPSSTKELILEPPSNIETNENTDIESMIHNSKNSSEIDTEFSTLKAINETKIDVRARYLKDFEAFPVYHLFIIYTNNNGTEHYFRGGSSCQSKFSSCIIEDTTITGDEGKYIEGSVDWDKNSFSITVMKGKLAQDKNSCFSDELKKISESKIQYKVLEQNSNSVVRTLLEKCQVPAEKPVLVAPGWKTILDYN